MSDASNPENLEGIAIVGMAGRFPGADTVGQFWKNLVDGVDCISRFKAEELEHSLATPEAIAQGQKFIGARGILPDADKFDAAFFGVYPREAELMDPQHRVFLECAWEAIESAGYDPDQYPGMIGVFAGLSLNTYLIYNLCTHPGFAANLGANFQVGEYHTLVGNDKDFMPTRVSYRLNLRGPSMTVQCGCSTSLVAVAQACTSLQTYQCDMALAGGVSISFPQKRDYLYTQDGMMSADGTCRTFDADARGTVFSHGAGVVLLKRMADAVADGDTILAVIKGTALNNDGADKLGYAAPSVKGQAEVIAMAQAAAGVTPDSISYVEAHGTGTPLGDPIEVSALTQAFRAGGATGKGYCAIGSGKTHIGHLDAAAGVTGVIKTVLQFQHELIPPLLHFKAPNPKIDFANSPFYPVARPTPWKRGDTPRRAGVSALGVGGTNAHIVLEECPRLPASDAARPRQLLVLSARTGTALQQMAENLAAHLEAHPGTNLADTAYTLMRGRRTFPCRLSLVADSPATAASTLRQLKESVATGARAAQAQPSVAFVFPGQGAQYVNMGRELYDSEPVFRQEVDRCAAILRPLLGRDLREILHPSTAPADGATEAIHETANTQPAIFTIEYALARLWMSWGITPSVLLGHSIGEYVCAVLADVFSLEDGLALLATRARLMQNLPPGGMMAVRIGAGALAGRLPAGVSIAAENSPKLCTVSGPRDVLERWQKDLEHEKVGTRMLHTSHAFHSAMMEPMLPEFSSAAGRIAARAPKIAWVSTCTGTLMDKSAAPAASYWAKQIREPVRLTQAMQTLWSAPANVLLEVGPGQTLTQLARQQENKPAGLVALSSLGSPGSGQSERASLLENLGQLWVTGIQPDWTVMHAGERRQRIALPTYPFERKRFVIAPCRDGLAAPAQIAASPETPDAAAPAGTPTAAVATSESSLIDALIALLSEHSGLEAAEIRPDLSFVDAGFDSLFLTQFSRVLEVEYGVPLTFRQLTSGLDRLSALADYIATNRGDPSAAASAPRPAARSAVPPAATARNADSATLAAVMDQLNALTEQVRSLTGVVMSRNGAAADAAPAERDLQDPTEGYFRT